MPAETTTPAGVDLLRSRFNGQVILPGDPAYDRRREHFNRVHDKHPAVIVVPAGTADVVAAVKFARAADLEIAVSSGGKHGAGFSRTEGGIVIDLSGMRAVKVDPEEQTAWLQGGANGGDLQSEALVQGLGGVIGWMRGTGAGGVNLHGGFGMLTSKLGFAVDTILELELVTAQGEVLRVSPDENPDLFWALRGEAANFGIVTWIKQQLCPVPDEILAGPLLYDAGQAPRVLEMLNGFALQAPDDLTVFGSYTVVPEDPNYPVELHGEPVLAITAVHIGDPAQAEEDLRPLREMNPALDMIAPQGLYDFICSMDEYIVEGRMFFDMIELNGLPEQAVDILDRGASKLAETGLHGEIIVCPWGRSRENPAFPSTVTTGLPGETSIVTGIFWEDPADDERAKAWARSVTTDLRKEGGAVNGVYGNMTDLQDIDRDRRAFADADWKRLTELKAKYDPDNVFHLNHNIPPAS